jgi:hypothetical protein
LLKFFHFVFTLNG